MHLLLWIPLGVIIGWLAGKSLEGGEYSRSFDLIMGAGGAVIGGLVMRSAGYSGYSGTVLATFVVACCGALLTIIAGLTNGRTIYSRMP